MSSTQIFGRTIPDFAVPRWSVVLLIVVLTGTPVNAIDTPLKGVEAHAKTAEPDSQESDAGFMPYCGLYSLHTAMRALGRSLPFTELLKPEYISNRLGSSMADLIRAARDHGMHVDPMNRMTSVMLRQANCPLVLHVKQRLGATQYNHWVLFMGMVGNGARIYDGNKMSLEPVEQLSARWDGTGLLVSDRPIDRSSILMAAVQQFLLFAVIVVTAVLFLRHLGSVWQTRVSSWGGSLFYSAMQATCIVAIASTVGWGYRGLSAEGYLSQPDAVARIQNIYKAKFLPVLEMSEIARMLGRTDSTIVDARWAPDYEAGHIPGAINIPPNTTEPMVAKAMGKRLMDRRVIVYCQSPGCPYSEGIAERLMKLGYSNLALYRGGWVEWKGSQNPKVGGAR